MSWREDPDFVAFIKCGGYRSEENDDESPFAPFLYETWKAGKEQVEHKLIQAQSDASGATQSSTYYRTLWETERERRKNIESERDNLSDGVEKMAGIIEKLTAERDAAIQSAGDTVAHYEDQEVELSLYTNRATEAEDKNHRLLLQAEMHAEQITALEHERDEVKKQAEKIESRRLALALKFSAAEKRAESLVEKLEDTHANLTAAITRAEEGDAFLAATVLAVQKWQGHADHLVKALRGLLLRVVDEEHCRVCDELLVRDDEPESAGHEHDCPVPIAEDILSTIPPKPESGWTDIGKGDFEISLPADDVPKPKPLTQDELAEADREAGAWRLSVEHGTKSLDDASPTPQQRGCPKCGELSVGMRVGATGYHNRCPQCGHCWTSKGWVGSVGNMQTEDRSRPPPYYHTQQVENLHKPWYGVLEPWNSRSCRTEEEAIAECWEHYESEKEDGTE